MTHSDKKAYFFKIDTTVKKVRNFLQKQLVQGGIDLTVDQWVVVDHLAPSPGLVDRKIAIKDRRKQMLFLTNKGKNLHGQAFPIVADMRYKVWEKLSDSDFNQLVRIMDTIYSNVD
jgi:macrodomain Ter protein organizer (MatP/YcbG family)